jgi:hypothetical protein
MPFPATRKLLKEAGYDYLTVRKCTCGASMELWHTPKDQTIPMNPMPDEESKAESHFATCPLATQFRRAPR